MFSSVQKTAWFPSSKNHLFPKLPVFPSSKTHLFSKSKNSLGFQSQNVFWLQKTTCLLNSKSCYCPTQGSIPMAVLGKKPFFLDFKKNLCPTTPSTLEQVLGKSSKTTEFLKPPVFLLQKPESSFSQTKKPESLRRFPRNQKKNTPGRVTYIPLGKVFGKNSFSWKPPFQNPSCSQSSEFRNPTCFWAQNSKKITPGSHHIPPMSWAWFFLQKSACFPPSQNPTRFWVSQISKLILSPSLLKSLPRS